VHSDLAEMSLSEIAHQSHIHMSQSNISFRISQLRSISSRFDVKFSLGLLLNNRF